MRTFRGCAVTAGTLGVEHLRDICSWGIVRLFEVGHCSVARVNMNVSNSNNPLVGWAIQKRKTAHRKSSSERGPAEAHPRCRCLMQRKMEQMCRLTSPNWKRDHKHNTYAWATQGCEGMCQTRIPQSPREIMLHWAAGEELKFSYHNGYI